MPGVQISPTTQEIDRAERDLRDELANRAVSQLSSISGADDVHVRDILPEVDLQVGADNGWNGNDRVWTQNGLAADTQEEVYTIDSDQRADSKLIGIIAISNINATPRTTEITFEDATGGVFERLQVQGIYTEALGEVGLLEDPIIFNADQDGSILQWADTAGDDEVVYHGAVAEQVGRTLAERAGTASQTQNTPARQVRR